MIFELQSFCNYRIWLSLFPVLLVPTASDTRSFFSSSTAFVAFDLVFRSRKKYPKGESQSSLSVGVLVYLIHSFFSVSKSLFFLYFFFIVSFLKSLYFFFFFQGIFSRNLVTGKFTKRQRKERGSLGPVSCQPHREIE